MDEILDFESISPTLSEISNPIWVTLRIPERDVFFEYAIASPKATHRRIFVIKKRWLYFLHLLFSILYMTMVFWSGTCWTCFDIERPIWGLWYSTVHALTKFSTEIPSDCSWDFCPL